MYIHKKNGNKITSSQYYQLSYFERQNYRKESSSSKDIVDVSIGIAIGSMFDSSSDSYSSSSSSDSSSFSDGFGGGDFSGGGAGGDW